MRKFISLFLKIKYLFRKDLWVSFNSVIDQNTYLEGFNKIFPKANVRGSYIGLGTYIGRNSLLPKVKIGRFSSIGPEIKLIKGKHPAHTFISTHPAFFSIREQAGFTFVKENKFEELSTNKYSVQIGNDVWIGANVFILDGVKIGDGAVIGSGAMVSKDIEPYSINIGNPIKIIKYRFEEKEIDTLLKLKWWNWDLEKIKNNADKFENIKNLDNLK